MTDITPEAARALLAATPETPTGDDREALAHEAWLNYCREHGYVTYPTQPDTGADFWAGFEAGYAVRRPSPPFPQEPTEEQVEAAARAMFEDGTGDYTWAQMVSEDPSRADLWREDARRVLVAAARVGGAA